MIGSKINWNGEKYTRESIRDRVIEWEVIDSGFQLIHRILLSKEEPYSPYGAFSTL
jgi:hypothetical protein